MLIKRTVLLSCPPEQCYREVQTSRLLQYVASPLIQFVPVKPKAFPLRWEQKEYLVSMRLFGILSLGRQFINVSSRNLSSEMGHFHIELRDNGRGTLISRWDHLITIEATPQGCRYSDHVEVKAGLLTPLIWLFAWFFYKHRQHRWQLLVNTGFCYPHKPIC